jgi:hypothetical protein
MERANAENLYLLPDGVEVVRDRTISHRTAHRYFDPTVFPKVP